MSITVERHFESQESAAENFNGNRRIYDYSISWRCRCTEEETAADVLFSDELFAEAGLVCPDDPAARRTSLGVDLEKGAATRTYIATASYSTDRNKANRSPIYPDTLATADWSTTDQFITIEETLDEPPEPITNTADDKLAEPIEINVPIDVVTIKVGLSNAEWAAFVTSEYVGGVVNSGSFMGFPAGHAQLLEKGATTSFYTDDDDNEHSYKEATFRIGLNRLQYNPIKKLNSGFNEINGDGEKVSILNDDGTVKTDISLLDADGLKTDEPHYEEYNCIPAVDFSVFGWETY